MMVIAGSTWVLYGLHANNVLGGMGRGYLMNNQRVYAKTERSEVSKCEAFGPGEARRASLKGMERRAKP